MSEPVIPTPLEEILRYTFRDRGLFEQAITHSSCYNERKQVRKSDNEKLEFLGDAILNTVVSVILYNKYKDRTEGFLSNARSCLVKRDTLTEIARAINLESHMVYGNGHDLVPVESKVLSNMFEAIIGAVYLDSGIRAATRVIKRLFTEYLHEESLEEKNPKNMLQEHSQKKYGLLPRYRLTRKAKNGFTIYVYVGKDFKAKGTGKSKKEAEQQAARALLAQLLAVD